MVRVTNQNCCAKWSYIVVFISDVVFLKVKSVHTTDEARSQLLKFLLQHLFWLVNCGNSHCLTCNTNSHTFIQLPVLLYIMRFNMVNYSNTAFDTICNYMDCM